jgi:hypothetical protein
MEADQSRFPRLQPGEQARIIQSEEPQPWPHRVAFDPARLAREADSAVKTIVTDAMLAADEDITDTVLYKHRLAEVRNRILTFWGAHVPPF